MHAKPSFFRRHKKLVITLAIILAIVLVAVIGFLILRASVQQASAQRGDKDSVPMNVGISELIAAVSDLREDLPVALEDVKRHDWDAAYDSIDVVSVEIRVIRNFLTPLTAKLTFLPANLAKQVTDIQTAVDFVDLALEDVLLPVVEKFQTRPLSALKVGEGIDLTLLCEYLDFAEERMPTLELLLEQANSIDLSVIDENGKLAEFLEQGNSLMETYQKNRESLPEIKAMLGMNENRLYILAAQNSSEIRASGGFPGAMGLVRIENGILTLEDFTSVYDLMPDYLPPSLSITGTEYRLFTSYFELPWDACYCPDFERVGEIWAESYEFLNNEHVDGVISMTPVIVQKLLVASGREVTLSDGLVLTGENAVQVLQHDLYFKYLGADQAWDGNSVADAMFAEAARSTMDIVMSDMDLTALMRYMEVAKEAVEDRTLMLWMERSEEQEVLREMHWNAGLNQDELAPEAGVYYNCSEPSKMGYYLGMDTEIGERVDNGYGAYMYPVTVTLYNSMSEEDLDASSSYITGAYGGAIRGYLQLYAPAGGQISEVEVSDGTSVYEETYHGLDLQFTDVFLIYPGETVTVTYMVTAAPGADAMLEISQTPTVQAYW